MPLLTKIKTQLVIHSRRKVTGLLEGQYASLHAGRSLDFSDLRDYLPGDDVSDIDWKASARTGSLLVKRYVADRKHTLFLLVDTGRELAALADWLAPRGLVVVERAKRSDHPLWPPVMEDSWKRGYGETALHFAMRGEQ